MTVSEESTTDPAARWSTHVGGEFRFPRLPAVFLDRDELTEVLDGPAPLTVVRGPSGTGKTALLASWARTRDRAEFPVVWVAVDPETSSRSAIWVATAMRVAAATDPSFYEDYLDDYADEEAALRLLDHIMVASRTGVCIVFDSYDVRQSVVTDQDVVGLLERHPNLRILVATRTTTALEDLETLAHLDVSLIGPDDLALTRDQALQIVGRIAGAPVAPAVVPESTMSALEARLLGYAVERRGWNAREPDTGRRAVADVIVDRARMEASSAAFFEFALKTALAEHLTYPLANQLSGSRSAMEYLRQAEEMGLGTWHQDEVIPYFRYSPSIAEVLYRTLERERPHEILGMRRTLAGWAETNGFHLEALRNAVLIKDFHLASRITRDHWAYLWRAKSGETVAVLEAVDRASLDRFPTLTATLGLALKASGRAAQAREVFRGLVEQLSHRGAGGERDERLWRAALRSIAYRVTEDYAASARVAHHCLQLIPELETADKVALAPVMPALLEQLGSDGLDGVDLRLAISAFTAGRDAVGREVYHWFANSAGLALSLALDGEIDRAELVVAEIDRAEVATGWKEPVSSQRLAMARIFIALERFELAEARLILDQLDPARLAANNWALACYCEASLYLLEVRPDRAIAHIRSVLHTRTPAYELPSYALEEILRIHFVAMRALGHRELGAEVIKVLTPSSEAARLLTAYQTLLDGNNPRALEQASRLVHRRGLRDSRRRAMAQVTYAIALTRLERPEAAGAIREAAATLNETGLVTPLLVFSDVDIARLAALDDLGSAIRRYRALERPVAVVPESRQPIVLTSREYRVLQELRRTASLAEVAGELFVTVNTVKTQARSLYRKLGASSRAEALVRAAEVGLLD